MISRRATKIASKFFLCIMPISLFLALSACTSQELYNQTKLQVKTHCNTKVGIESQQCLEKANTKLYKEYEAERLDIIEGK